MTEWKYIELGEGLAVNHGFAFKGEHFSDRGKFIVLTPGNFWEAGGFKIRKQEKFYRAEFPKKYLLAKGNVVVAMTEQSPGLLGSSATIPNSGSFLHNQRLGLLEITNSQVLDLRFVYHLMNSADVRQQIQATATGSKVRHTAPERIASVKALVPSVKTQRTIAAVLDSLDSLIENNWRQIELIEQIAEAIYREWFVHFRFPGHEGISFVDSPLGSIPEGWRVDRLGDLVNEVRDSVKPSTTTAELPYVPIDEISPRSITLHNQRPGTEAASSLRLFKRGDILFGAMRAYFHKVCLAPFDGVTRSTCLVLRPSSTDYFYSCFTLARHETVAYAATHSAGSTIPYTKWDGALAEMLVVRPESDVTKAFGEMVAPLVGLSQALVPQVAMISTVHDLLLPKLVSGQIDVSDLDLDALVGPVA